MIASYKYRRKVKLIDIYIVVYVYMLVGRVLKRRGGGKRWWVNVDKGREGGEESG